MGSKEIIQHAKNALLYDNDLLLEEDDEIEDEEYTDEEATESEGENCNEDEDAASKSGEDGTGQNENDDEKTMATKSKKNTPKSKKSSKGIFKKIRSALDPTGLRKINWRVGLNLDMAASNMKDPKETKTDDKDDRSAVAPLLPDTKKIKNLEKENKKLAKLAKKYLEGCIRLKQRVSELSKVEDQLSTLQADYDNLKAGCIRLKRRLSGLSEVEEQFSTLQADYDGLKAELLQHQKLHQDFKTSMETQNTEYREQLEQLNAELKIAIERMEKMKATNEEQVNETCRLKKELEAIASQKENISELFENTELSYRFQVDELETCLQQARKENTELTERILKIEGNFETAEKQISESSFENMVLQQKLQETECERDWIKSLIEACSAKTIKLSRIVQTLEVNPSRITTHEMQTGRTFSCPTCRAKFDRMANMHLHAQDCTG